MDIYSVILGVVLGDTLVMGLFVLILNPRLGTNRIKKEIVDDRDFMVRVVDSLLAIMGDNPGKLDPLYDRLQEKIQGTILSDQNVDRQVDRLISKEIVEQNPDIEVMIDLIGEVSPRLKKVLKKHPEFAPKILDQLKRRGLLGSGEEQAFDPYA